MSTSTPVCDAAQARATLRDAVRARLSGEGAAWLEAQGTRPLEELKPLLPQAARHTGPQGLVAAFAERAGAQLGGVWGALPVGHWSLADAARVWLLSEAAAREPSPGGALYAAYDQAGTEVKVACLRALNFVAPEPPEVGLALVHDAGRTYLPALLGAAWTGNPYSALHLSDHDYRKAVLKAFFCDVPVGGFLRLEERATPELAQSLCEYVDERLAAGRTVPRDIWPLAALHPRPGLVARLIGMLEHPDPQERATAARALRNARDPRALSFLRERREREADAAVRAALDAGLAALEGASS